MFAANASRSDSSSPFKPDTSRSGRRSDERPVVDDTLEQQKSSKAFSNFASSRDTDDEDAWRSSPLSSSSSLSPRRDRSTVNDDDADYSNYLPEFVGTSTIEEDSIYCKNEQTLVAYFGPLPREVEEALSKTDFYTQPMVSKIDLDAGFGMVISQKMCYIWAVQKDTTYRSPPVCYTLPMPPNSLTSVEASVALPVVTFTKSDDDHCGIMACSPDGTCWLWSNIDLCFSNVNQHVDTIIDLAQDEYVTHVECAGPMGYFFGTKFGNVYQITIKKQHGSTVITPVQLQNKAGGAMASIFSLIGRVPGPDITQKIASLTSGPKLQDPHGRWDLYALTRRSLLKWQVHRSGDCTLETEAALRDQVTERIIRDNDWALPPGADPEVRLWDIEYIKNGKLLVLITFFAKAIRTHTTPLSCALLTLSSQYGTKFDIENVKYIQRPIEDDLRPEASPKLVVPQGGPGVFIITPSTVIISSTLPNFDFEDIIPLKSDRIIGFGCEDWKQRGQEMGEASELSIVCRSSGRLGIHIQVDGHGTATTTVKPDITAQLQAKLEQGVFFGAKKHNPISFDLSLYDGGDLNVAALNVSQEILNSRARLLTAGSDMTSRLAERYQRTKGIIDCIRDADMGSRLSTDTRFQLCWNAEKLAAAHSLWNRYQSQLADSSRDSLSKENLQQVVQEAATATLQQIGAHVPADPVSFFLKYHVGELSHFLASLQKSASKFRNISPGQQTELMRDVNKMLVLSLRSAWNYRRQNVGTYSLQGSSSIEPWTATGDIIKALTAQYDKTLSACRSNSSDAEAMDVDGQEQLNGLSDLDLEMRDQLCDLADVSLQAHSEHLIYLEGFPTSSSEQNITISKAVAAYEEAKSRKLGPLVSMKMTQAALMLSQKYKDFISLVKLCAGQDKRIDGFVTKYQQEFADALFQHYLDNNQVPKLLEQGEKYSDLFTVFLDNHDYSEIAWLQDIKIKRYIEGSGRVQDSALLETNIDRRRTMFSLSKLLFVAGMPAFTGQGREEKMMKYASRNNMELEMATIQTLVANEWESHLGSLANVQDKANAAVDKFGSQLLKRQPQLRKAIVRSVESLLNREAIGSEDLLDVLMLQQRRDIGNFDVCDVALLICLNAADIPESRRPYVLQDIWRRVFIADDELSRWKFESVSDSEARERLMATWMARAYILIYRSEGQKDDLLLRPEDTKCRMPKELFLERFQVAHNKEAVEGSDAVTAERNCQAMIQDYELENQELERRLQNDQLSQKWVRIKHTVKAEEANAAAALAGVRSSEFSNTVQDVEMADA
ncbi:hypothetical protein BGZ83_000280 [Gryganskiella cystojenkinii]|nr:hypothetical protein BGZ83_000280 [Gryganskiella cystojenkinii]